MRAKFANFGLIPIRNKVRGITGVTLGRKVAACKFHAEYSHPDKGKRKKSIEGFRGCQCILSNFH